MPKTREVLGMAADFTGGPCAPVAGMQAGTQAVTRGMEAGTWAVT